MKPRKSKPLIIPLSLLVKLGALGFVVAALSSLPHRLALTSNANSSGTILVALALIGIAIIAILLLLPTLRFRSLRAKVLATATAKTSELARRRKQLVQPDHYGYSSTDRWQKEIEYFLSTQVVPNLSERERSLLSAKKDTIAQLIDEVAFESELSDSAFGHFSVSMSGAEFETFCAAELTRAGWNARVTTPGKDQGIDIVAENHGLHVILQCKKYSRPVGNKAVQEAFAAKTHEQAEFAAVVSNNTFTASARQLAQTTGVLLLHYSDLKRLEQLLRGSSQVRSGLLSDIVPQNSDRLHQ